MLHASRICRSASAASWQRHMETRLSSRARNGFPSVCATRHFSIGRRKRPSYEQYPQEENVRFDAFSGLKEPFRPKEDNVDDYLKKVSLSPWVPVPEAACRKYFDMAEVQPGDIHVDLGSGDGRVCFYAVDYAGVEKSTGVDVDEEIMKVAWDRLARRHPKPKNLDFVVADLLDPEHPVWEIIQEATIITMFFQEDALKKFRPLLEQNLVGRKARIITAGYAMPTSWTPFSTEVILGTNIYLYKWGYGEDETPGYMLFQDNMLEGIDLPIELQHTPIEENEKYKDMEIIDHTLKPKTMDDLVAEFDRDCEEEEGDLFSEDELKEQQDDPELEKAKEAFFDPLNIPADSPSNPILTLHNSRSARGLRERAKEESTR